MKIGILGGSFNPPHIMHKKLALSLIEKKYVDKVIFVPVGSKYKKDDLIDDNHRFNMLKLICDENLTVSRYEMGDDLKYTYQTMDYFHEIYPEDELYFILGFDNLAYFHKWKNYRRILEKYKLLVVARGEAQEFADLKEYSNRIIFTDVDRFDVSSSEIRKELSEKRYSDKVDQRVLDYISDNNLYNEDLYEFIFKRRSVRKYLDDKLDESVLNRILTKLREIKGLNNPKFDFFLSVYKELRGVAIHKAPHYLVVTGDKTDINMIEVGFVLQKWSLWLNSVGIGNVWIGMANFPKRDDVIIVIGFGRSDNLFRSEKDFKRKALNEIYNGSDEVFNCARLAPSGMNGQPWYFLEDKGIFVFKRNENLIKKAIYSLIGLDMGIVLANLSIGYNHFSRDFVFEFGDYKKMEGYKCIGKIK